MLLESGIRAEVEGDAGEDLENATVLSPPDAKMDDFPAWFPQVKLNFAENILFPAVAVNPSSIAVNFRAEIPELAVDWTWSHLREEVGRLQAALRAFGVRPGDRIAAYCANCPQVLAFMLAGASMGAVFTAASPDFGPAAVIDRFGQTEPRVLLTCNAVYYNGRVHDHNDKINQVLSACPFIEQVIAFAYIRSHPVEIHATATAASVHDYNSLPGIAAGNDGESLSLSLSFTSMPFSHPLYILYSSGTTGKPKCITHGAGGTLLQHCKEHWLHGCLDRNSCLLQYTTIGWMMWQWQVSALQRGSRIVLYDGSPFKPGTDRLLCLIDELRVTHFGTSAKYLMHLQDVSEHEKQQQGHSPLTEAFQASTLRTIFSTGSPLPEGTFCFLGKWLPQVQVASITGGTDIVSLFAGGCPTLPVHAGEIQAPCLGMAIEARATDGGGGKGCSVLEGDLVCVRPFPCQPVKFWGDDAQQTRYRAAYFSRFPHIWHHGDFIRVNPLTGGIVMLGRSDGTLNPAGVRFGSADLYAICAQFAGEIEDALAVGVRRPQWTDEQVYLFLKLKGGDAQAAPDAAALKDDLKARLVSTIRSQLSPRHVPAQILACPGIPYTLNGKKVEVAVKRILSGATEEPAGSLADPSVMEFYRQLGRELARVEELAQESKL